MTSENKHVTTNETEQVPTTPMPADRAVVALVRIGTRRCRLAAAFMAVVVGLASQIGLQSVAQAKQSTLYLDAPAVSTERASRAGDAASAYSTPDAPVSSEILAWLGVPTQSFHVSQSSGGAEKAFSSITAPDGEEAGGVTVAAALRAGQVMLAQIGGSPSEDGGEEPASAGAVRPQLGSNEPTPEAEPEPEGPAAARKEQPSDAGPTSDAGTQAYDSTSETSASSGEPGIVVSAPADVEAPGDGSQQTQPAESVSAASDTGATPIPGSGTGEEVYGPTGPVSNTGQAPTNATTDSPEDGDDEYEQSFSDDGVPVSEPDAVPDTGEGEFTETEPTNEETGPTNGEGGRSELVPVSPPSVEEETTTTEGYTEPVGDPASAVPPGDADGSDPASEEPIPEETPDDASNETDTPSTTSTEPSTDEPGEEHVEIVVVVEGASQTEMPAETPPEQPTTEQLPADQARPEDVSPSVAPPVEESPDGEAPSEGGTPRDHDTEQGRSPSEEAPSEDEPAEHPPAREEPAAEQPNDALPDEGQTPADGESPSAGEIGARRGAPTAPPEDLRSGGEPPEDPEGAATPAPDDGLSENPNDTSEGDVAPPPDDQVPENSPEGGRDERQEEDLQKEVGPQEGEGGPEFLPSDAGEQVEENGGGGEPLQEKPQDPVVAPEQGGAIQQEQTVIVEVGGDSSPELPTQDAPRITEESVALDPEPEATQAPVPTSTEEPADQQHAAGRAQADRRSTPEPTTADRSPAPKDADGSPEGR